MGFWSELFGIEEKKQSKRHIEGCFIGKKHKDSKFYLNIHTSDKNIFFYKTNDNKIMVISRNYDMPDGWYYDKYFNIDTYDINTGEEEFHDSIKITTYKTDFGEPKKLSSASYVMELYTKKANYTLTQIAQFPEAEINDLAEFYNKFPDSKINFNLIRLNNKTTDKVINYASCGASNLKVGDYLINISSTSTFEKYGEVRDFSYKAINTKTKEFIPFHVVSNMNFYLYTLFNDLEVEVLGNVYALTGYESYEDEYHANNIKEINESLDGAINEIFDDYDTINKFLVDNNLDKLTPIKTVEDFNDFVHLKKSYTIVGFKNRDFSYVISGITFKERLKLALGLGE